MYDLIRLVAPNGVDSIDINELTEPCFFPVERFTWTPEFVGDQRPKLAGAGRHWNYRDVEVMDIVIEGHIKADTTTQYWQKRDLLVNIAVPDMVQTFPFHGFVMFKRNGDTETYYQHVTLENYDIPTEALYPTVTPMRFEWSGLDGYWLKLSNNQPKKI